MSNKARRSLTGPASSWMIRNLIFPGWVRRDHPAYPGYIGEFERTQFLSKTEIAAVQLNRLRKMLQHAYEACPFYRQRMQHAGFNPNTFHSVDQLAAIPVLTKTDIQQHGREMEATDFSRELRVRNQTGGSTGS